MTTRPRISIQELRREYESGKLDPELFSENPFTQFTRWFEFSVAKNVNLADAMTLATVDENGYPDARIVLLKEFDEKGAVFFTNYRSQKSQQLEHNRHAALLFFWPELERQVRMRGEVKKVTTKESDAYFTSRPKGAQLSAWASNQSTVVDNRDKLEQKMALFAEQFKDKSVPRPRHWGGYRLHPQMFEFWQGRADRLHDRLRYRREKNGQWIVERLAP